MEFIKMGNSLKLCAVVDGQADIYLRLGPTNECDAGAVMASMQHEVQYSRLFRS